MGPQLGGWASWRAQRPQADSSPNLSCEQQLHYSPFCRARALPEPQGSHAHSSKNGLFQSWRVGPPHSASQTLVRSCTRGGTFLREALECRAPRHPLLGYSLSARTGGEVHRKAAWATGRGKGHRMGAVRMGSRLQGRGPRFWQAQTAGLLPGGQCRCPAAMEGLATSQAESSQRSQPRVREPWV